MAIQQNDRDMEDLGVGTRLIQKAERNPFLAVGILGFLTTVGIGAYRFKKSTKNYPISLFLIQLRVTAQSVIIGTLTLGMAYNMLNEYVLTDKKKPKSLEN